MNSGEQNKLFILIDGHSLAFRAYYAFAKSRSGPLRTSSGIPTSVCFGFLNSLLQLLETQKPTYLAVAFDLAVPSFRHEADVNYKANRQETPEEFRPDLTNLQSLLTVMNIPIVTSPGYEADDVLGTLAKQAGDHGYTVKILTGDRDLFQLVDEEKKTTVLYLDINAVKSTSGQGYTEFNSQAVTEKLGVTPKQVVDFKALCGDKSDNIPGVRGIGEKTAIDLLKKYDNLEDIYTNLESIKGMVKTKLLEGKLAAESSRYLAKMAKQMFQQNDADGNPFNGYTPKEINEPGTPNYIKKLANLPKSDYQPVLEHLLKEDLAVWFGTKKKPKSFFEKPKATKTEIIQFIKN